MIRIISPGPLLQQTIKGDSEMSMIRRMLFVCSGLLFGILLLGCDREETIVSVAPTESLISGTADVKEAVPSSQAQIQPIQTSSQSSPDIPKENNEISKISSLADKDLQVKLVDTPNGFQVQYDSAFQAYVLQSLSLPKGDMAIHVVRRTDVIQDGQSWFRKDAIVVNPSTKEVHVFPLMNAMVSDSYSADSVAKVFGFIDDHHMIYAAAAAQSAFNLMQMDITNGQANLLFANQPENVQPDFYANNWISMDKSKLALSSFRGGELWVYDLAKKTFTQSAVKYPSSWPLFSMFPSPDGLTFWYKGKLYDLNGKEQADLPDGKELPQYPPITWSPTGKLSAYSYAFDDNEKNIINYDCTAGASIYGLQRPNPPKDRGKAKHGSAC
jgi:hypothetical protein